RWAREECKNFRVSLGVDKILYLDATSILEFQIEWNNIRNRRARGGHICLGNKVNHDLLRAPLSRSDIGEVLGLPLCIRPRRPPLLGWAGGRGTGFGQ